MFQISSATLVSARAKAVTGKHGGTAARLTLSLGIKIKLQQQDRETAAAESRAFRGEMLETGDCAVTRNSVLWFISQQIFGKPFRFFLLIKLLYRKTGPFPCFQIHCDVFECIEMTCHLRKRFKDYFRFIKSGI